MCVWFSCVQLFRKLLLHKCQEEFENRRQATAGRCLPLSPLSFPFLSSVFLSSFFLLFSHSLLPSILYFFVPLSFPLFPVTAFDKRDGLTPEEEEQKIIAKRKMLGNIKFVGKTTCKDRVERLIKAATVVKLCNADDAYANTKFHSFHTRHKHTLQTRTTHTTTHEPTHYKASCLSLACFMKPLFTAASKRWVICSSHESHSSLSFSLDVCTKCMMDIT